MPKTIFDMVKSGFIASYWMTLGNDTANVTEALFPATKQVGLNLKWIKGARGLPVVMKASAFDAAAVPRGRIGFSQMLMEMPYYKESSYIDEELRQQLNQVLATDNQVYIDSVMNRVFDDEVRLLRAAAARREQMRAMMLTTGSISIVSNGQHYEYDFGVTHKANAVESWSDPDSNPIEDIRIAKEVIQSETGETLTRAMCDGKSWRNLRNNAKIWKSVYPVSGGGTAGVPVSDRVLKEFVKDETGLEVVINDHRFVNDAGVSERYTPENTFVMFPSGPLGNTWFGTTPAESDLAHSNVANVSIVDTGVAITTIEQADPVQVLTIASQICLPSFERADSVYILDTVAAAEPPEE